MELRNDQPIVYDEANDILGHSVLAKKWAKIIFNIAKNSGNFTFSIEGPWGSGKSSIIENIRQEIHRLTQKDINNHIRETETGEQILVYSEPKLEFIISSFSPWRITDLDSMLIEFFKVLADGTKINSEKEYKKAFLNLIKGILPLATLSPAGGIIKGYGNLILESGNSETLEESFQRISKYFKNNHIRKIIIVDDIDRLDKEEALLIFKLVKTIGSIPGVTCILLFDREQLINSEVHKDLDEYLEKFIQHSFTLPTNRENRILSYLFSEILVLAKENSSNIFTKESIEKFEDEIPLLYNAKEILKSYFPTIRQVNRFLNYLSVEFNNNDDKTLNLLDLVCISILRFFLKNDRADRYLIAPDPLGDESNELFQSIYKILTDTKRTGIRLFKNYRNGGPYINSTVKLESILNEFNSNHPDPKLLDEIEDSDSTTFDLLDLVNSNEYNVGKIENPLLFSYYLYKFFTKSSYFYKQRPIIESEIKNWSKKIFVDSSKNNKNLEGWETVKQNFTPSLIGYYKNFKDFEENALDDQFDPFLDDSPSTEYTYEYIQDQANIYLVTEILSGKDDNLDKEKIDLLHFIFDEHDMSKYYNDLIDDELERLYALAIWINIQEGAKKEEGILDIVANTWHDEIDMYKAYAHTADKHSNENFSPKTISSIINYFNYLYAERAKYIPEDTIFYVFTSYNDWATNKSK